MTARNVPLAEAKGQSCGKAPCAERAGMESELRRLRREIRTWWKPPADAPTLY